MKESNTQFYTVSVFPFYIGSGTVQILLRQKVTVLVPQHWLQVRIKPYRYATHLPGV
jgi:hypothetical protein